MPRGQGPPRLIEPDDTVHQWAARRRGAKLQAEYDAEIRDLQRYGGSEDQLERITSNPNVRGRLTIRKTSDDAIAVENEEGATQFLVGTQPNLTGTLSQPVLLVGPDIRDIYTGFAFKVFGNEGHIRAPQGFLATATHSFARWFSGAHKRPASTSTIDVVGMPSWTVPTMTSGDDALGMWGVFTTAATTGSATGPNGPAFYRRDQEVECLFRVKTGPSVSDVRYWVGLFDGDPSGSNTPNLNFAGFRYASTADSTWIAYVGNGSARSQGDTTIPVLPNQTYYLRVRLWTNQVRCVIGLPGVNDGLVDGTWTVTFDGSANIPNASTLLAPYVRVTTLTNAAKSIAFGFFNALSR